MIQVDKFVYYHDNFLSNNANAEIALVLTVIRVWRDLQYNVVFL